MADPLYQNRDQSFPVTIFETDGTTVKPAGDYGNAEYRIYEQGNCTPLVTKTLGSGIIVSGDDFVVSLTASDMSFNVTGKVFQHEFIAGVGATELSPDGFLEVVEILARCA